MGHRVRVYGIYSMRVCTWISDSEQFLLGHCGKPIIPGFKSVLTTSKQPDLVAVYNAIYGHFIRRYRAKRNNLSGRERSLSKSELN